MTATGAALARLAAPLRRLGLAAAVAGGLGLAALALAIGAVLSARDAGHAPRWILLAWGLAAVVLAVALWLGWRALGTLGPAWLARALETAGAWRRGALSAFLEPAAPGTSAALLGAADRAVASDLDARGPTALESLRAVIRRRAAAGLALGVAGCAALAAAAPPGTRNPVWRPARAWTALVAPVQVALSAREVDRGGRVRVDIEAIGRQEATLWLRAPGEAWTSRTVALDADGRASTELGPLETDLFTWAESGGRASDTLQVAVRLPALLAQVAITAHYPAYLRLEDEPVPTSGDTLVLPAGTRLEVSGRATQPLGSALWRVGAATAAALEVTGDAFRGNLVPGRSDTYTLALATPAGASVAGDPLRLPVRLVPDSAPVVEIPMPGADTTAPVSLRVPLVVNVTDDHGIENVVLESRRITRLGEAERPVVEAIPLPTRTPDRALLTLTLDLTRRGLLPGDTIRYLARAADNAPRANVGRSREFVLRLPTLTELREAERRATQSIAAQLDSAAKAAKRLERETEDLSREQPRTPPNGAGRTDESLSFEESKKAEAVAQRQQQLMRQAEQLKQALRELEQKAEAAGTADSAWQQRLQEIREQLDRAMTPELRRKLAELQQSLKELDGEQAREQLRDLKKMQEELREALERSRELFRRAAIEGDLKNLTQETRELTREQAKWNDQAASTDSARAAAQERQLAQRADSVAAALEKLADQVQPEGKDEALRQQAQQARNAAKQMQQAAKSMQQGKRQQAREQGEQAEQSLTQMGSELEEERDELVQQWRQEITAALDRALAETSRLAEQQLEVLNGFRRGTPQARLRSQQGTVEEGVGKLRQRMQQLSGRNALVPPRLSGNLAAAQQLMQRARESISSATGNQRDGMEAAGGAVDLLNAVALQLLRARGAVSGSGSGSGLAEAMQQMAQMAGKQGQIGQQSEGLLPQMGGAGSRQQMMRLGAEQRALAQQLERLRGQGEMPGAGEMAQEAKELARQLETGRLDRETVRRQEQLFRRMLDAGRTLQGKEEDEQKERESTTARDDSVRIPPALRARLQDANGEIRLPSWDELQRLAPAERRLVVDYFRQLTATEGGR